MQGDHTSNKYENLDSAVARRIQSQAVVELPLGNPCHITSCNRVNKEDNIIAGTKAGGIKAAQTNKARHGKDFYCNIGRKGGQNGNTGGFAANRELARVAGAKGGRISRRPKKNL